MSNTLREDLQACAIEQAVPHVCQRPEMAGEIAKGINTLIDGVLGAVPKEASSSNNHASQVLYPAINAAMDELEKLHPGFNLSVNKAFNILRKAFWSEAPVPASASPERAERICTCGPNEACGGGSPCVPPQAVTGSFTIVGQAGSVYAQAQMDAAAARVAAVDRMHTNPSPADTPIS